MLAEQTLERRIEQLQRLKQQLPPLTFIPQVDAIWAKNQPAQDYLNFYKINFAQIHADMVHGFGYVDAASFRIATHYWLPVHAQGTLVIVHGYYDHVGLFNHAIAFALQQNLAVLAFDLPGHGLSSGAAAVIDNFDQYADVLAVLLRQSQTVLPQPIHSLAQSTGCAITLNYLWRYTAAQNASVQLEKMVLCGPLILASGWSLGQFVYVMARPFIRQLKRGAANSSHDQHFNDFIMQEDPLQAKYLSLKWVGAMKAWHQQFCGFTCHQKELLVIQGTADSTVDWRYNLPLIQCKLPNANVLMIEDAKHQLINESKEYRVQVFAAVASYLSL